MAAMRSASTTIAASWCTVRAASDVTTVVSRITIGMRIPLPGLGLALSGPPHHARPVAFRQAAEGPATPLPALPVIHSPRFATRARTAIPQRGAWIDGRSRLRTVIHGGDVIAYHDGGH